MPGFKSYTGLGGGCGGADYVDTVECDHPDEAMEIARQSAIEEYESYEGNYGLLDWEGCREDLIESGWEDPSDEDIVDRYYEEIESWIDYYVDSATGPDDRDDREE